MTDYFALLAQPRSPWLDPDELKQIFHARTLQAHPDAQTDGGAGAEFVELNEAYQTLRDPKRRLQHLLSLSGQVANERSAIPPKEIEDLFSTVAELTQRADAVMQKAAAASTALSASLVKSEMLAVQKELETNLARLGELQAQATAELRNLGDQWQSSDLENLYLRFSYLNRWIDQLEERRVRLTL